MVNKKIDDWDSYLIRRFYFEDGLQKEGVSEKPLEMQWKDLEENKEIMEMKIPELTLWVEQKLIENYTDSELLERALIRLEDSGECCINLLYLKAAAALSLNIPLKVKQQLLEKMEQLAERDCIAVCWMYQLRDSIRREEQNRFKEEQEEKKERERLNREYRKARDAYWDAQKQAEEHLRGRG